MERTTEQLTTAKRTHAVAYYVTNQGAATPAAQAELFTAIRGHWGCEADHWIRDVTLQEDQIPVQQPTQAHVLGTLRTLVLGLFRRAGVGNVRALLDELGGFSIPVYTAAMSSGVFMRKPSVSPHALRPYDPARPYY